MNLSLMDQRRLSLMGGALVGMAIVAVGGYLSPAPREFFFGGVIGLLVGYVFLEAITS